MSKTVAELEQQVAKMRTALEAAKDLAELGLNRHPDYRFNPKAVQSEIDRIHGLIDDALKEA